MWYSSVQYSSCAEKCASRIHVRTIRVQWLLVACAPGHAAATRGCRGCAEVADSTVVPSLARGYKGCVGLAGSATALPLSHRVLASPLISQALVGVCSLRSIEWVGCDLYVGAGAPPVWNLRRVFYILKPHDMCHENADFSKL